MTLAELRKRESELLAGIEAHPYGAALTARTEELAGVRRAMAELAKESLE